LGDAVRLEYQVFFPENFPWVKGGKLPGIIGGRTGCGGGDDANDCFSGMLHLFIICHFRPFIRQAYDQQDSLQFEACGGGMEKEKSIFTLQRTNGVTSFVTQKEPNVTLRLVYL